MKFHLLGSLNNANPKQIHKSQIESWERDNLVAYLGSVDDVREIIANTTCIVLPSYYKEGIPRSLLEAMAMGKPIITTNVPGCKECIKKPYIIENNLIIGSNGILIPPRDSIALKNAMLYLAKHPTLVNKMRESALEIASNRFNITHTIAAYKDTINPIAKQSKIAFISNTCFGMYNFRLSVLKELKSQGYEIHIIAPFDKTSKLLEMEGFILHDIFIDSKSKNPLKDLKTILELNKILHNIKPNFIFSYTIKCVIYGSYLANRLNIPNIAVITGLGYVFIEGGIYKKILKFIVCKMYKIALRQSTKVWFLNTDDKDEFLNNKIIANNKAFILDSEGVDTKHFSPSFKPKHPKNDDEIVFLLIARMLWDKGIGEFVEAAKMLKEELAKENGGGGESI